MAELLTVREVSEKLKVTPLTVRRWLRRGDLIGIQLGDRAGWRISEDDLDDFLRRRRSDADRPETGKAEA
jgi:excisionase family DNA binding protein